jgi:DNA-binding NtrC family response regulator
MNAAISGRAGLALLLTDDGMATLHVGEMDRIVPRSPGEVRLLLQRDSDYRFLEDVDLGRVRTELLRAWEENEALDLALAMLDPQLSRDVRTRAITELVELLAKDHVHDHLRRIFYSAPFPAGADPDFAIVAAIDREHPRLADLFSDLIQDQEVIARVRTEFEQLHTALGETDRDAAAGVLARDGVSLRLVEWLATAVPRDPPPTLLDDVSAAQTGLRDPEAFVERWMAALAPASPERSGWGEGVEWERTEPPISVLVVDDEEPMVQSWRQILAGEGYTVHTEGRGKTALEVMRRHRSDVVLAALALPDMDGLQLLEEIKKLAPETVMVVITGPASIDRSVEAIRAGVYDYVVKPFTAKQLRLLVGRAAQQVKLARDNAAIREQLNKEYSLENIIGTSDSIQKVLGVVRRVAPTDASVFISGESGTGKGLFARTIHTHSLRSLGPFGAINCAALPDNLLESELFGHEPSGFFDDSRVRRGLLAATSGGTFFLDEITEMSMELQGKLLRVIQEQRVRGAPELPVDVRWVTATSRDPDQAVREGRLRQDLLYRLNLVPVKVPPLRDRREDIPALGLHFLRRYARKHQRGNLRLGTDALRILMSYAWPGNVRELHDVIERVVMMSPPDVEIRPDDLPAHIMESKVGEGTLPPVSRIDLPFHDARTEAITAFEKEYLRNLLLRHNGNISHAARTAGMDRKALHRLLAKYQLEDSEDA